MKKIIEPLKFLEPSVKRGEVKDSLSSDSVEFATLEDIFSAVDCIVSPDLRSQKAIKATLLATNILLSGDDSPGAQVSLRKPYGSDGLIASTVDFPMEGETASVVFIKRKDGTSVIHTEIKDGSNVVTRAITLSFTAPSQDGILPIVVTKAIEHNGNSDSELIILPKRNEIHSIEKSRMGEAPFEEIHEQHITDLHRLAELIRDNEYSIGIDEDKLPPGLRIALAHDIETIIKNCRAADAFDERLGSDRFGNVRGTKFSLESGYVFEIMVDSSNVKRKVYLRVQNAGNVGADVPPLLRLKFKLDSGVGEILTPVTTGLLQMARNHSIEPPRGIKDVIADTTGTLIPEDRLNAIVSALQILISPEQLPDNAFIYLALRHLQIFELYRVKEGPVTNFLIIKRELQKAKSGKGMQDFITKISSIDELGTSLDIIEHLGPDGLMVNNVELLIRYKGGARKSVVLSNFEKAKVETGGLGMNTAALVEHVIPESRMDELRVVFTQLQMRRDVLYPDSTVKSKEEYDQILEALSILTSRKKKNNTSMFRPLYKDSTRDPYTGDWHTVFGLIHLVPDEFIKYDRRVVVRAKYDQTDQGPMGQFTVLLLQNIPGTRRMRVALKLEMKNIDMSAALAERRRF